MHAASWNKKLPLFAVLFHGGRLDKQPVIGSQSIGHILFIRPVSRLYPLGNHFGKRFPGVGVLVVFSDDVGLVRAVVESIARGANSGCSAIILILLRSSTDSVSIIAAAGSSSAEAVF